MTVIRESALRLVAKGLPVFPCGPDKRPRTDNGWKDASNDPRVVRNYCWRADSLIGTPTGAITGFDVLDIDPRHGGDTWERDHADRLPPTRVHATRSGGRHYLFRHREGVRNSENRIATGVDVRGDGGYCIFWPSHGCEIIDRSRGAEWPDWLLPAALPPARQPVVVSPRNSATDDHNDDAVRHVDAVIARVRYAAPGSRHVTLRNAAITVGGLLHRARLSKSDVTTRLLAAVVDAGGEDVDQHNAIKTIDWALAAGSAKPLQAQP